MIKLRSWSSKQRTGRLNQMTSLLDTVQTLKESQPSSSKATVISSHKANIPKLTKGMSLKTYKYAVSIWQHSTDIPAGKQALMLLNEMPDEDNHGGLKRIIAENVGITSLQTSEGVKLMLKKLDELLLCPTFVRLTEWIDDFENLRQDRNTTFERFITESNELKRIAREDFNFEVHPILMAAKIL